MATSTCATAGRSVNPWVNATPSSKSKCKSCNGGIRSRNRIQRKEPLQVGPASKSLWNELIRWVLHRPFEPARKTGELPPGRSDFGDYAVDQASAHLYTRPVSK